MKIWMLGIVLLLLSGFVFAAEQEEAATHDAEEGAAGETGDAHAEAAEEHQGIALGEGLQLVALASVASIIALALVYFFLSKKR